MTELVKKKGRFVLPGSTKLPLWEGDLSDPGVEWIEVRSKLTYGDEQRMASVIFNSLEIPQEALTDEGAREKYKDKLRISLDLENDGPYKILTWGLDWNLEDGSGELVEFCLDSIMMLDTETAAEINRVIDEHAEAAGQRRGKSRRKKERLLRLKS